MDPASLVLVKEACEAWTTRCNQLGRLMEPWLPGEKLGYLPEANSDHHLGWCSNP